MLLRVRKVKARICSNNQLSLTHNWKSSEKLAYDKHRGIVEIALLFVVVLAAFALALAVLSVMVVLAVLVCALEHSAVLGHVSCHGRGRLSEGGGQGRKSHCGLGVRGGVGSGRGTLMDL